MIVMAAHIRLIVDRHFIDIDDSGKSVSYIIFRIPSVQTYQVKYHTPRNKATYVPLKVHHRPEIFDMLPP